MSLSPPIPATQPPPGPRVNGWDLLALFLPIAVTLTVYLPNLPETFVGLDWESYQHVIETRNFVDTTVVLLTDSKGSLVPGYYAPIGSISLMLDKWFAGSTGPDAFATSLFNLLLHCLNAVCIVTLLKVIDASPLIIGLTIFFFLVNPVQVSSVLWFAERKTLLGGVFFFLCLAGYIASRKYSSAFLWWVSLILFIFSVLTKPVSLVVPAVLLASEALLPLPRLRSNAPSTSCGGVCSGLSHTTSPPLGTWGYPVQQLTSVAWPLVKSVGPFWAIAALSAFSTLSTEHVDPKNSPTLLARALNLGPVLWFYVAHTLIPTGMLFIYPMFSAPSSGWDLFVRIFWIVPAIAFLWRRANKGAVYPLWGYAVFILALAPATGLVRFGWLRHSPVADHFLYLATLGSSFAVAWDITMISRHGRRTVQIFFTVMCAATTLFLTFQTWSYAGKWRSNHDLWEHNAVHNPSSCLVQCELGRAFSQAETWDKAIRHYHKALELKPTFGYPHIGLGVVYERTGDFPLSLLHYRRAAELMPLSPDAHHNVGKALMRKGSVADAINHLYKAAALRPFSDEIAAGLGAFLLIERRFPEAAQAFARATAINSTKAEYYNGLGVAYAELNHKSEAEYQFLRALQLDPKHTGARLNLGALGRPATPHHMPPTP